MNKIKNSQAAWLKKYPPSNPCACEICRSYCVRPGWWTPPQALLALEAGLGPRMMLEVAPEKTFAVLAPAFRQAEGGFALQEFSKNGCTFLNGTACELHGSAWQPLECRFCHHLRRGQGKICHADLEREWRKEGRKIIITWLKKDCPSIEIARYYCLNILGDPFCLKQILRR